MSTHKPFRELLKPGSNFEFVGKTRLWAVISVLLILGSVAMLFINKSARGDYLNWTIDFKGGTEMVFAFRDKETKAHVTIPSAEVRKAVADLGGGDVSEFQWVDTEPDGKTIDVHGMLIRTPRFGAVGDDTANTVRTAFETKFADRELLKVQWSGDRMFVRSKKGITEAEGLEFFTANSLEMKPWGEEAPRFLAADEGTGEFNIAFSIWGVDRQFQQALSAALPNVQIDTIQTYAVGAKAGAQLRNDGIKSLFYAMTLIMLYLAFRFDIRYAPGAIVALIHDSIIVVGVFALTWTDVSLTTVAALLTVIGYSVNDTVIIFDRIRENAGRLKDKKLVRIANISLNETMSRTILTSGTLLVVTLMMNIFGTGLVQNFAFALNIGVIVGTYSSIFIAAPVFLWMNERFYSGARA